LADVGHGGALGGQDQLGRLEVGRLNRPADGPDSLPQPLEGGPESRLVVALDCRLEPGIELIQLARCRIVDPQLALAEDTDDHVPSPAWGCSAGAAGWAGCVA